jgi:hypothetical protein
MRMGHAEPDNQNCKPASDERVSVESLRDVNKLEFGIRSQFLCKAGRTEFAAPICLISI